MRKILSMLCLPLLLTIAANSQTTYEIDFSYESLSTSACNVFASTTTVDNFQHKSTVGFPKFLGNPDYCINLPCKRVSQNSKTGTEYQVLFPFKKDYRYQVTAYYKGTIQTAGELYPSLGLGLRETAKTHNTSTNCTGPQAVTSADYWQIIPSGSSWAWPTSPPINTTPLDKDYAVLLVAGYPGEGASASGNLAVQVRKISITEFPPFTLSPTSVTVNCGVPLTQTFTVTTPPSVTGITGYTWNLGSASNNWIHNGSPAPATISTPAGTNSITLTSANGQPSNVSVSVLVNGSPSGTPLTARVTYNGCPTINPTTVNVTCNVASTHSFTLNNTGNIPGVTGSSWNLGPSPTGWLYNGSPATSPINISGNTLSLTSVTGATQPNNVSGSLIVSGTPANYAAVSTLNFNNCPCSGIGTSSNLFAVPSAGSPPGFYVHFDPVPGATSYSMDWYNVTLNSYHTGGLSVEYNTANVPGNFFYYMSQGYTYKFRIVAMVGSCPGPASAWSANYTVPPAGGSCATGPAPSSLSVALGCAGGANCPYTNFNWTAVPGASQYQVEYTIFNVSQGITRPPVTFTTIYNNTSQGITPVSGSGWAIKFRVKANCSGTWGSFSNFSPTFAIY